MRLLLGILILASSLLVCRAQAEPTLSLGTAVSYQLDTAGRNYEMQVPFSARAGYRFEVADLYLEYSQSGGSDSGNDMVTVKSSERELLLWVRKTVARWGIVHPFLAAGFGGSQQTVTTRFGGTTEKMRGQVDPLYSAAAGLQLALQKHVQLSLEGRVSSSESYEPNLRFGTAGFVTVLF